MREHQHSLDANTLCRSMMEPHTGLISSFRLYVMRLTKRWILLLGGFPSGFFLRGIFMSATLKLMDHIVGGERNTP